MSTTEVGGHATGPAEDPAGLADLPERATGPIDTATAPDPAGPPVARADVRSRTARRVLALLAPGLLYLAVRGAGVLVLEWLAGRKGVAPTAALTSWDGQWYLAIARYGYGGVPATLTDAFGRHTPNTALAFFPGYPLLVRWAGDLPGVDLVAAAFTVSLVCGVVCAYGLVRLAGHLPGDRGMVGLVLVVLFAASPMAIALSMAYSEALFCALAAWSLVGVVERRWLLAGLAAAGTGLVRPTAAALVATVCVAAVIALVRRRDGWRPVLGLVLAPAGLVGYLLFVAHRTGELTGWFALQRQGWNSAFDGGAATVRFGLDVLGSGRSVLEVVTVAVLVAAIVLAVLSVRLRIAWPLVAYGTLVLVMDLGANGLMNSKARLLLPAFTLLVPYAVGLARRRPGTMVAVLAGVVVASSWFGAYSLTGWPYAI